MKCFLRNCRSGLLKVIFTVSLFLVFAGSASAGSYTWIGTLGGSWGTASNWNSILNGHVPGAGDDVVFNDVVLGYTVTLSAAVTVNSITVLGVLSLIGGVTLNTQGHALTVSSFLTVGQFYNTSGSIPGVVTPTIFTILGSGAVTINTTLNVYTGGVLNAGSTSDNTTNLIISGATANVANLVPNSLISNAIGLLTSGAAPTINNYGTMTANSSAVLDLSGYYSQIINYGTITANSSATINLTGNNSLINNTDIFNAGTSGSACTVNVNAPSAAITNAGSSQTAYFNVGSTSVINVTGGYQESVTNASTNSVFTLMSDPNGSAAIGPITVSGTPSGFVGVFNVQRYITGISSSYTSYRLLSSPVNSTSAVSASTNYISLYYLNKNAATNATTYHGVYTGGPGGTTGGFNVTTVNPIIYFYNETLKTSNRAFTSGKNVGVSSITSNTAVTPVTSTETFVTKATQVNGTAYTAPTNVSMPVGNGYIDYFVGPNTIATASGPISNAVITNVGYINQQNVQVYLWYTPGNGTGTGTAGQLSFTSPATGAADKYQGFNMVGNPYPCTISLASVFADNITAIDNIYVLSDYNPGGQEYNAYTPTGNSSPSPAYVASGQGFQAHAISGGQTLIFKESEKAATTQLTGTSLLLSLYRDRPDKSEQALSGLYMKMVQDSVTFHYCGIYFNKNWVSTFQAGDAIDINGSLAVSMSSYTSDGVLVAVNHQPDYRKGLKVKLYANAANDGIYKLNAEGIRNIDTLYDIFLIDHYKNDSLDMRRYGSYAFNIYKSDTSSFGSSRFELSIHPRPLPPYKLLSFVAQKVKDGIQLTWKTESEANYTGFVLQKEDGTQYNQLYSTQSDGRGVYTFTDHNPISGSNTYRLQQSGMTGNITYSSPVTIVYDATGTNESICVYPNPVKDVINLTINRNNQNLNNNQIIGINSPSFSAGSVSYGIKIMTITGTVVMSNESTASDWHHNAVSLAPGPYIIQVINNNDKSLVGKSMFIKI